MASFEILLREVSGRMTAILRLRAACYAAPGIFATRLVKLRGIFLGRQLSRQKAYSIQMVRERLGIE